jgi:hypothetical protein
MSLHFLVWYPWIFADGASHALEESEEKGEYGIEKVSRSFEDLGDLVSVFSRRDCVDVYYLGIWVCE